MIFQEINWWIEPGYIASQTFRVLDNARNTAKMIKLRDRNTVPINTKNTQDNKIKIL